MLQRCDSLNVTEDGTGPTRLVLAHGAGADQGVWRPYLPWLGRGSRVLRYDLTCAGAAGPASFDLRRHPPPACGAERSPAAGRDPDCRT